MAHLNVNCGLPRNVESVVDYCNIELRVKNIHIVVYC